MYLRSSIFSSSQLNMPRSYQEIESSMDNRSFEQPILNSPYEYPRQHWEFDDQGQPTQQIIKKGRRAEGVGKGST